MGKENPIKSESAYVMSFQCKFPNLKSALWVLRSEVYEINYTTFYPCSLLHTQSSR